MTRNTAVSECGRCWRFVKSVGRRHHCAVDSIMNDYSGYWWVCDSESVVESAVL